MGYVIRTACRSPAVNLFFSIRTSKLILEIDAVFLCNYFLNGISDTSLDSYTLCLGFRHALKLFAQ